MRIVIITANRSEHGILTSLYDEFERHREHEVIWIELPPDGFDKQYIYARACLFSTMPDWVFLFGDRPEQLAAAYAATELNLLIAHHHGGDKTDSGYRDEAIRHSITRFAHIHFAACESSAERLEKMGEQSWRIHNVGSLAIDGCAQAKVEELKIRPTMYLNPYFPVLVLYNPVVCESSKCFASKICDDISERIESGIFTKAILIPPNGDPGSEDILKVWKAFTNKYTWAHIKEHPRPDFLRLLADPHITFIGNSSAMYVEASYFHTSYEPIGVRNVGRQYGGYGDGHTSPRIRKCLEACHITTKLRTKKLIY